MNLTAEQKQIASMIDTKVQELSGAGCDDASRRFPWFYRYAKILESVAAGIQSGSIKVPK